MCAAYVACRSRDAAHLAKCRETTVRLVEFFLSLFAAACGIDRNMHICACIRTFSMGRMHAYIPYALFAQVDRDSRVEAAVSDG